MAQWIVLFALAISSVLLASALYHGRVFGGVAAAYFVNWLGLGAMVQLTSQSFPVAGFNNTDILTSEHQERAAWLILIAATGLLVGTVIERGRQDNARQSSFVPGVATMRIRLAALFSIGAGVAILGPTSFLFSRADRRLRLLQVFDGDVAVSVLADSIISAPAAMAALIAIRARLKGSRALSRWDLLLLFVANALANSPLSMARFWWGAFAGAAFFIVGVHRYGSHRGARRTIAIWLLILVFVFPIADLFRNTNQGNFKQVQTPFTAMREDPDFDSYPMMAAVSIAVDNEGHKYGAQIIGTPIGLVPRRIMPGKPEASGPAIARAVGWDFGNLAGPLPAELFFDFGYFGVFGGLALYGYGASYADRLLLRRSLSERAWVILAFFAFYQLIFLRGSSMIAMNRALPALATLLLLTPRKSRKTDQFSSDDSAHSEVSTPIQVTVT